MAEQQSDGDLPPTELSENLPGTPQRHQQDEDKSSMHERMPFTAGSGSDKAQGSLHYGDSPPNPSTSAGQAKSGTADEYGKETHERKKSRMFNFAVDFAYTLNHAIVCTLTDPVTDVPIGATVQNVMGSIRGNGEKVSFGDVLHGLKPSSIVGGLKDTMTFKKEPGERFSPAASWLAGEVAGDFGAVPVVVGLQHFAPGFMKAIGKAASPVAKPIFKRSAERSARAEFKLAGMDTNTPEFEQRVKELYERELDDLPKAIMWTGVSPAINILLQKTVMGNKAPVIDLVAGKMIGATVTSSLTLGLRATSPSHAQKWDNWASEKAGKPIAKVIAKMTGMDEKELKAGMKEKMEEHSKKTWGEKVSSQPSSELQR